MECNITLAVKQCWREFGTCQIRRHYHRSIAISLDVVNDLSMHILHFDYIANIGWSPLLKKKNVYMGGIVYISIHLYLIYER